MKSGRAVSISFNNKVHVCVGGDSAVSGRVRLPPPGRHGGRTRRQKADAAGGCWGAAGSSRCCNFLEIILDGPGLAVDSTSRRAAAPAPVAVVCQDFNLLRRPLRGFTATHRFLRRPSGFVPLVPAWKVAVRVHRLPAVAEDRIAFLLFSLGSYLHLLRSSL
jgi:hypothetical protein